MALARNFAPGKTRARFSLEPCKMLYALALEGIKIPLLPLIRERRCKMLYALSVFASTRLGMVTASFFDFPGSASINVKFHERYAIRNLFFGFQIA
jgi:hypothetical protein